MKIYIPIFAFIITLFSSQTSFSSEKGQFNLFNPVPDSLMRGFETDRPDATESPITVDAGHFQLETDLLSTNFLDNGGVSSTSYSFAVMNFKAGITNTTDLQVIISPYYTEDITVNNITKENSGFGGVTIRLKQNIWGNDGGNTALGIIPFVNFSSPGSEEITGGVIVPLAVALPGKWGFSTQAAFLADENEAQDGHVMNLLVSAVVSRELFENFGIFAEGLIFQNTETETTEQYIHGGFGYEFIENVKADAGIFYGIKDISPTTFFLGVSVRR